MMCGRPVVKAHVYTMRLPFFEKNNDNKTTDRGL